MATHFHRLDLNLLRVLGAIYRSGSVTEAGRQLALSQPATSNALARLRDYFGDALFVRSPSGLKPTRLCERVAPAVIAHLQSLQAVVSEAEPFDPASTDMHWRLSLSDLGEMMFLPPLAAALRRDAPHSRLTNVSVLASQVSAALESREIDLAIGILQPRHQGIRSQRLFEETYLAISGPQWRPAPGRAGTTLTQRQLEQAALVVASPLATFHASVDQALAGMKLSQRIVLRPRHFGALPDLVAGSDLLAIVPAMYAHILRARHGFRVWNLPGQGPRYAVSMVWHGSTDDDPAQAWLRGLCLRLLAS